MVLRWQQLPLDHATSCLPCVQRVLVQLAGAPVPDLGPAVAMDQLTVLAYDACQARRSAEVSMLLADLRHELASLS